MKGAGNEALLWLQSSPNLNTGTYFGLSQSYTVEIALLCTLLIATYVFFSWRRKLPGGFQPSVIVALFLGGWLILDLGWQHTLLHRIQYDLNNKRANSGLKLSELDHYNLSLHEFTARLRSRISSQPQRIFVSSANDYLGMRAAFYLYPHNVYWERYATDPPDFAYLLQGDYLLLLEHAPNIVQTLSEKAQQRRPTARLATVYSGAFGTLFRVE
jgi:hypothetical protein